MGQEIYKWNDFWFVQVQGLSFTAKCKGVKRRWLTLKTDVRVRSVQNELGQLIGKTGHTYRMADAYWGERRDNVSV